MEGMSLITLSTSLASILFAYLAFKRSDKEDKKNEGKSEWILFY